MSHVIALEAYEPIGRDGRTHMFHANAKPIENKPGWFHVHMFADRVASRDVSTTDVMGVFARMREDWIADLKRASAS